jgi:ADP-ribose pyrophosphatase
VVFPSRVPLPPISSPALQADLAASVDRSGFLRLERVRVRIGDGEPFTYDVVTRDAMDAVVMAAHFVRGGTRHVMMCSCIRVPLFWRDQNAANATLWELPAGLVEVGESPAVAAARELHEEIGVRVDAAELAPLGPPMFPAPGMIAEVHSYFHVEIDPSALEPPTGDSSALERESVIAAVPLDEALALCASGGIRDGKTELAIRRLKELLP